MKISLVFFVVAVLALADAKEDFQSFHAKCRSASENSELPSMLCMNVELGVMKPNGDIDRNELKAGLKNLPFFDSAMIEEAAADCGERRGATADEAANALTNCLRIIVSKRRLGSLIKPHL